MVTGRSQTSLMPAVFKGDHQLLSGVISEAKALPSTKLGLFQKMGLGKKDGKRVDSARYERRRHSRKSVNCLNKYKSKKIATAGNNKSVAEW